MNIRKNVLAVAAGAFLLIPSAALAVRPFDSSALNFTQAAPSTLYQRYANLNGNDGGKRSPGCAANCAAAPNVCENGGPQDATTFCQLNLRNTTNNLYRGYQENTANFANIDGVAYDSFFDMQVGAGTGDHRGYYGWTSAVVNTSSTSKASDPNCTGTTASGCLGNLNSTNSKDAAGVPNRDGGAAGLERVASMSPIPPPRVTSHNRATGAATLAWDAVTSNTGGRTAQSYELLRADTAPSGGVCPQPNETQFGPTGGGTFTTNSASVNTGTGENCVTYALRVVYGSDSLGPITSRFISGNSQTIYTGAGGLSATIINLAAKWINGNNVEINWQTSLEDGVRGFYVTRAVTEAGPYVRVSTLVPAKGEASSYSFIDAVSIDGKVKATGLYYKVETLDIDDQVTAFGPAKASLPVPGKGVIQQRQKKTNGNR
jgi:hypothetical protein